MNILILNHNLRERGTWHRAHHIGRELARRGHRVTLWTAAPHHYYRSARHADPDLGDRFLEVETPSWAPLAGPDDGWGPLDVLWRLVHAAIHSCDLCYAFAHPPNVWLPAWVMKKLRRKPLLYDWCDWYAGGIFPKREAARRDGLMPAGERAMQARAERWEIGLEQKMLRLADRVTVISTHLRELAIAAGRRREEIFVLPNGANLDGIKPEDHGACRRELKLDRPTAPVLGYAANYHPDQALLLTAVARAAKEVPGLRFLVAGAPLAWDLVHRLGLEPTIVHLGQFPAENIGIVLGAADVLALPLEDNASNRARVPYKFTDYLAAGRPIVTSPVGDLARWFGPPEGTTGDETTGKMWAMIGIAAPPHPESYGSALAKLLNASPADRAAMGRAARTLAEKEFAWPRLVDKLERFMEQWLHPEKKPRIPPRNNF